MRDSQLDIHIILSREHDFGLRGENPHDSACKPVNCRHRSLIADALVARGWEVRHILSQVKADEHRLTPFAVIDGDTLVYPQPTDPLDPPQLF